jgi:hypothetical protein
MIIVMPVAQARAAAAAELWFERQLRAFSARVRSRL